MATKIKKSKRNNQKNKTKKKIKSKARKTKRKVKKKALKPRDKIRNVGLDGRKFSKIKQEYHDIDYAHKLSEKEKQWLSAFMEEDLGARFNHPGKKIYKKKSDRIESFRRNNARQRDMYSLARATGLINNSDPGEVIEALQLEYYDSHDVEEKLIDMIDKKKSTENAE